MWGVYISIFVQHASGCTFRPSRSSTSLKETSDLHNVNKEALGILLLIIITVLPSDLKFPEQQVDPEAALIIFRAFIISGVVPTLVYRHGLLNKTCQSDRALGTCPHSWNHVQIAAHPPEDATDDMVSFDYCCSLFLVVVVVAFFF